ncbi:MAG: hypothetical protein PHC56_07580 [Herbinix sp.]|nr:hypothetical protein [Herbinix sp.]
MLTKKLIGIFGVIVMVLLLYTFFRLATQEKENGTILDINTSEYIRIWDGRTGESYKIDREDYVTRIRMAVDGLKYLSVLDESQADGSSYNIIFENEDGSELSHISYAWPEDIVYVNDHGYELVKEEKYLLYAYVADALYLQVYDDMQD